jgi:hypothetical protein
MVKKYVDTKRRKSEYKAGGDLYYLSHYSQA